MNKVRITAIRQTVYPDLMAQYENPIEHTCDVKVGQQWISVDGQCPDGMCPSAWSSMREFVESRFSVTEVPGVAPTAIADSDPPVLQVFHVAGIQGLAVVQIVLDHLLPGRNVGHNNIGA